MASEGADKGLKAKSEDALGKLAQDLLDNPLINGALTAAMDARERATQAQTAAMGALNIPSASDIERLTRRVRAVSQRLEGLEDGIDRVEHSVKGLGGGSSSADDGRLSAIETKLDEITAELAALRERVTETPAAVAREQQRLEGVGRPQA
jgi:hypothetical protein